MNVFKEMGCSLVKPAAYSQFLRNKKGKIFGYGMLLMVFYFVLSVLLGFFVFMGRTGGIGHMFREEIPEFEVTEYGFWVERPFVFDGGTSYIALNSNDYFDESEAYRFVQKYQSALLVDSEKLMIKSNGQVQTMYFNMLDDGTYFSKESIIGIVPIIYLVIVLVLIFYFIIIAALFFFGVLIVSLLGLILNAITKAGLTFGQIYILGIYARTWPLLFKGLVVRFLGVQIPFFWVINFGVTLIYMFLAMKKMERQPGQNSQYVYVQTDPYNQGGYGQNGTQSSEEERR